MQQSHQAHPRLPVGEDGLCGDQGVRGDVDVRQFKLWIEAVGGGTEVSFVNRLFGVYA